ncbi:hypothetical protein PtrCC142_003859 [Pyrenophora tritici-repentis]|nr:Far-17a-AIG1 domain containing protein [Pyrenophora tritici-repentis]KAI1572652.1 Far-17a-AIG1 domain containing protein [Pyrenophora tritici-repentis]KAI1603949.1 hypothetical protein PtrCC142_003859 [Pyrenophora tritici-repentis]
MKMFTYKAWGIPNTGFDPSYSFVRSHFVSPVVLACIRALLSIYCFATIIISYSWLAHKTAVFKLKDVNIGSYSVQHSNAAIGQSFSFFTYLTFWSLGFYFMISSVHTFMYAFRKRTWLYNWPKALQLLHSMYYSTMTSLPFLVTIVFWGTMNSGWPPGRFEQWHNLSVHALNSVFAAAEITLSATEPLPWNHLSIVLGILSMYLGLAYLTQYAQGFYVYEWMNPAHGNVSIILHVLGYAGGMIVLFAIARYAIVLRNMLAGRIQESKDEILSEKLYQVSAGSENSWTTKIGVVKPTPMRVRKKGDFDEYQV